MPLKPASPKFKTSTADTWLALGTGLIALVIVLPILTILALSFTPSENIWPHLISTVLPGYVWRTLGLLTGVGFLTFIIGTATAWLVTNVPFHYTNFTAYQSLFLVITQL